MYSNSADPPRRPARTVPDLRRMKIAGERIASLTAYDASFARAMDVAGIDAVLVGDSLGMVVQGGANTVSVSVADMLYHSRCVAKGLQQALLIAAFLGRTRLIDNLEFKIP
jgi:3-methyl-2-oxobutanoate hydroxymethyltransferase